LAYRFADPRGLAR